MNSKIAVAVGLAAVLAATIPAPISTPTPAFAAEVAVDITANASTKTTNAYSPNPAEINVGDTVIWTNQDAAAHSATSGEDATPTGLFGDPSASGPVLLLPAPEHGRNGSSSVGGWRRRKRRHPAGIHDNSCNWWQQLRDYRCFCHRHGN